MLQNLTKVNQQLLHDKIKNKRTTKIAIPWTNWENLAVKNDRYEIDWIMQKMINFGKSRKFSISKTQNELEDSTFIPNFEDLTKTIRTIISAEKKQYLVGLRYTRLTVKKNVSTGNEKKPIKGQLNSEWIDEVIVSPKMPTKNYKDFCPTNKQGS